jgi:hypothetical protein
LHEKAQGSHERAGMKDHNLDLKRVILTFQLGTGSLEHVHQQESDDHAGKGGGGVHGT